MNKSANFSDIVLHSLPILKSNMDDTLTLLLLSLAMLVGCYVAGSIPLAISLSEVNKSLALL